MREKIPKWLPARLSGGLLLLLLLLLSTSLALAQTPTIVTGKADYAPSETVDMTGTGFAANTSYDIVVIRPDGSIIKGDGKFNPDDTYTCPGGASECWDTVTSDGSGDLTYDYILDGIEGLYEVYVYTSPWDPDANPAQTPVATTTFTDAPDKINGKDHESQQKVSGVLGGYSPGNTTEYTEGDPINFRLTLTANNANLSGQFQVKFSLESATCTFFDGTFVLGTHDSSAPAVVAVSGAAPTVTLVGTPVAVGTEWVQTIDVSFTDANSEAVVNYYLTLEDDIGDCSGSSQHSRLDASTMPGAYAQTGQQNVPVPANKVIQFPDILVIKKIDRDGDGSFESTANAGEYCFSLDGGTCVQTDANGEVLFAQVSDGAHTITEQQLDTSQGTYVFDSGTGTNCTFSGDTATATVAAGAPPTDATCTFNNKPQPTAITLAAFTVEANDGRAMVLWETGTEIDNAGFNLYRAAGPDGPWVQINSALILAEGDPVAGASYNFVDTPGRGTYYYRLEDVDFYGVSTLHDPFLAELGPVIRVPWFRPTLPSF